MFKKILFPTINSKNSGVDYISVVELAKKFDSEVVVVLIYKVSFMLAENSMNYYLNEEQINEVSEDSENMLNEIVNHLKKEGLKVKGILKVGDAGESIIETLNEENCDAIVMNGRLMSTFKRLLSGSISSYVLRNTKCPVLIVH